MCKRFLSLALGILLLSVSVHATTVTEQQAQTIAVNFFKANMPALANANVTATINYTKTGNDNVADFYIFNMSPAAGFVIVAADDNVTPVLGYSTEVPFSFDDHKTGIADWLRTTSAKIRSLAQNHIQADAEVQRLWTAYRAGYNPNASRAGTIGPLLTTTWNQEPYYNSLCPFNATDNQRTLTGCVATTMAQIMRYWKYPAKGVGSYTYNDAPPQFSNNYGTQSATFQDFVYNWNAMGNNVSSNTSPVDTLMYHCGVSVAMDYGDDNENGSGAYVLQSETFSNNAPCAQYAYVNYFSYNPNTIQGVKMSQYNATDWMNLMKGELNAGRVIQYEGDDATAGGHTWVCDGYDANGMLHMNWGWGGASNGYFAVTNLSGGGYNFVLNEAALIGIQPIYPVNVTANAGQTAVCPGGNTTLTATGPANATYTWSPTTGLDCSTCPTTNVTPNNSTLYTVTVDSAGIKGVASVSVLITQAVTANFTQTVTPACSLPQNVTFTNTSANATTYSWDFGDGTTSNDANPVHAYSEYGDYTIVLSTGNDCGSQNLTRANAVHIINKLPVASQANICPGQSTTLTASAPGGITWYDAETGGNVLSNSNTYTTPTLNTSAVYYAQTVVSTPTVNAGPVGNTIGGGSYYTRTTQRGLVFNCTTAQNLVSVDVYSDSAGTRVIKLLDAGGTLLDSVHVYLGTGKQTVNLNFALPVANGLQLCSSGFCFMYRNSAGAVFPYNSGDASVSITNNSANAAGTYYYFYNWKLQQGACAAPRTPVQVFVLGQGGNSFTTTNYNATLLHFIPLDTTATTYSWNFGDGSTSDQMIPWHQFNAEGTYTVSLTISNGTCSETITQTVATAGVSGINELNVFATMNVFPNPAKDELNLNISSGKILNGCQLTLHNVLGETVSSHMVDLQSGNNSINNNVSSLSSGVYFITLQSGSNKVTKRFVKQ